MTLADVADALRDLVVDAPPAGPRTDASISAIAYDSRRVVAGSVFVALKGLRADGQRIARTWQLTVPAIDGPEIPCMAAILVARRILSGESLPAGAAPCAGLLTLEDFAPEFARWNIHTEIRDSNP